MSHFTHWRAGYPYVVYRGHASSFSSANISAASVPVTISGQPAITAVHHAAAGLTSPSRNPPSSASTRVQVHHSAADRGQPPPAGRGVGPGGGHRPSHPSGAM